MMPPVIERLSEKTTRVGKCLEWTGGKNGDGYGVMMVNGVSRMTHRLAWEEGNGPIPAGMLVDHRCHNKACLFPPHLRLATRKQNNENKAGANKNSKSGVRGVCWEKAKGRWKASVRHNGKLHHGGYFDDLDEAGEAAKQLRLKLFTFSD